MNHVGTVRYAEKEDETVAEIKMKKITAVSMVAGAFCLFSVTTYAQAVIRFSRIRVSIVQSGFHPV